MMFGQIEIWDKEKKQGLIFSGDSRKLIPFRSDVDWEPGTTVQFETAVIAVAVRKNTNQSAIGVVDVSSDASQKALEAFKSIDVAAYFPQHGNIDSGETK
jgi:hypothetical protein